MSTRVMTDIQTIAAAGNYDVRPPVGSEWEVFQFGASVWVGVPPNSVPAINVGVYDGTLGPAWVLRSVDVRGWNVNHRLFINRTDYLRINNPGGAGVDASFVAKVVRQFGTAASFVITNMSQVAAAGTWDLIPPAGYEYVIYNVGSSMWIGAAPNGLPDVTVSLNDGTLTADFMRGAEARGWNKNMEIHINTANYLTLTNTNAAQADLAIVGIVSRYFGAGAGVVISDVQTIAAGANWDVRPPAGQEWRITEIGASIWLGVSPAGIPQLTVSIYDGTLTSNILISTDNKGWMHEMEIYADNTNYIRLNDVGGAGINAAISGALTRQYS